MNDQLKDTNGRSRRSNRRGATLVETALILGVFVAALLGFLDLGLAMMRQNCLTAGARRVSREATLRGKLAPPTRAAWGPETSTATADDESEIARAIRPSLVGIEPRLVRIQVEWPDGGNETGKRVRVTTTCSHESILPFLFGPCVDLRSVCVMRIAH